MGYTEVIKGIPSLTHYYPLNNVTQGRDVEGTLHADFVGSGVTFAGNGATFPGSEANGYLTIPHSNDFSVRGTGTDKMTLIFFLTVTEWLNTTNGNEYLHWAGKGSPSANNLEWGCRHYVDNRNGTATGQAPERQGRTSMYYWAPDGGTGNGAYLNAGDPETTSEIMMIVRMDAGAANYIRVNNGTTVVNTQPINGGTNASLVIGGPYNGKVSLGKRLDNTGALIGRIRRFAVFNTAITDAQIATLVNARNLVETDETTPPPPPPPPPETFPGTALDHYSIRSDTLTARMNDANATVRGIARGIHSAWLGDWMPTNTVASVVSGYVTAAAGKAWTGVLYAIPNRDSGNYSAGGFANRAEYLAWIQQVRNGSGSAPVWWILEPDAIGLSRSFTAATRAERQETIRQAVVILKQNPNARVYIDASTWVPSDEMAGLLQPAGAAISDGFSCNVSNFETTTTCVTWADAVVSRLTALNITGKKYVVDTSRNGNGPLPTSYPGSSIWHSTNQTWCNPPGRGIGLHPRVPTSRPNCAALLWVKNIGQSDGEFPTAAQQDIYDTNAPIAGTWWDEWFTDFAATSNVANTIPPTGVPLLQITSLSATAVSNIPYLQLADIALTAEFDTSTNMLQLSDMWLMSSTGAGTPPTVVSGSVRIAGADVVAARAGQRVDLSVAVSGSYNVVTWSVLAGSIPVDLAGSDLAKSLIVPAVQSEGDIVIGVRASGSGGSSAERRLTLAVVPHGSWWLSVDGEWRPSIGQATTWTPGVEEPPPPLSGTAVYPAADLYPSTTLYPGG